MKTISLGMAIIFMIITFVGGVLVGYRLSVQNVPLVASLVDTGGKEEKAATDAKATSTSQKEILPLGEQVKVIEALDGDTILIEGGEQVRYIGVDAPEGVSGAVLVCYANEAKEANKKLVEGKTVRLVRDTNNRDPFNRLLRYVYVEIASARFMVNEKLVSDGAAKATPYPPDIKFEERFKKAETEAKTGKRGLWAACGEK